MHPDYEKLQKKSYSNQVGGITIPTDELHDIVVIPLGFQPLGISGSGNRIAIAAYFEPAICMAEINTDENGMHFNVNWIRGVNHGIQSVRLFPDMLIYGEANRAQTVNFGPNGTLWVTRNADRKFFILTPSNSPGGRWTLTGSITLLENHNMAFLHAALLHIGHNDIYAIESSDDGNEWRFSIYSLTDGQFTCGSNDIIKPYTYGIGSAQDGGLLTISDFRAEKHGIYRYGKLAYPDIYGNGICLLQDGSALVTRYGQASPGCFNGEPGKLIYIPKHLLP
jgi:hypothetical protein